MLNKTLSVCHTIFRESESDFGPGVGVKSPDFWGPESASRVLNFLTLESHKIKTPQPRRRRQVQIKAKIVISCKQCSSVSTEKTAVPEGKFKRRLGFLLERSTEFRRHTKRGDGKPWLLQLASRQRVMLLSTVRWWHDGSADIDHHAGSAAFSITIASQNQYSYTDWPVGALLQGRLISRAGTATITLNTCVCVCVVTAKLQS